MPADRNQRMMRIADFLSESRIPGSGGDEAKKISVRLYGRGVVAKNDFGGSENTRYYVRYSGQFIYSKLDFLNGAFGIIPGNLHGYESTLDMPCFDFKAGVSPQWFLGLVSRPVFYHRFKAVAIGSRKANRVPVEEFLATRLLVPPLAEQHAIADVLTTVDDAIRASNEGLSALEHAKNAVMRELLTRGLAGEWARMVPLPERWVLGRVAEGVTHMPAGWQLVRLPKYAKLESGHTPDRERPDYWDGDIPWISLQDTEALDALSVMETVETVGLEGIRNSSARILPAGTVVFSRTATVGKASIMGRDMATSQDFANWFCGPNLEPRYLMQVFRHMQREWRRLQAGSTHQTIYMPTFKKLQILLPPLDEQIAIADAGEAFDRRIAAERAHLSELRATKDALAQELLSGRVRLPASMIARFETAPPHEAAAE